MHALVVDAAGSADPAAEDEAVLEAQEPGGLDPVFVEGFGEVGDLADPGEDAAHEGLEVVVAGGGDEHFAAGQGHGGPAGGDFDFGGFADVPAVAVDLAGGVGFEGLELVGAGLPGVAVAVAEEAAGEVGAGAEVFGQAGIGAAPVGRRGGTGAGVGGSRGEGDHGHGWFLRGAASGPVPDATVYQVYGGLSRRGRNPGTPWRAPTG
ncbi:MAG TPA: hypothetical protein PLX03_03485 [Candidatus Hydrogenedentes bacterium]|nr:hypothetical protein [Candidatus Hydrogenedentota bacterium]